MEKIGITPDFDQIVYFTNFWGKFDPLKLACFSRYRQFSVVQTAPLDLSLQGPHQEALNTKFKQFKYF